MSEDLITPHYTLDLLSSGSPVIDVRSSLEFGQASIPSTINIPILNDTERAEVGTTYKLHGQKAAVELGYELVKDIKREERIKNWIEAVQHRGAKAILCARGGLRSKITQEWLLESGYPLPRVAGGYKAIRQQILHTIEKFGNKNPIIISGRTGVGKTSFMKAQSEHLPVLDLEALANHRGSVFGWLPGGQPTQTTFENSIGIELHRSSTKLSSWILVEAESIRIGKLKIPEVLFERMLASPIIVLKTCKGERIANLLKEYVIDALGPHYSEDSISLFKSELLRSLGGISKRLGGDRHKTAEQLIKAACDATLNKRSLNEHAEWIEYLVDNYYDPLYDRYNEQKKGLICFEGTADEVSELIIRDFL